MNRLQSLFSAVLMGSALGFSAVASAQTPSQPGKGVQTNQQGEVLLKRFFSQVKTLQAEFRQEVENDKGRIIQRAEGQVAIARPGKFRWIYASPEPQEIVADGEKLWVYDKDLAQVTIRPLASALGNTPAALIAGQNMLPRDYRIRELGQRNGLSWVELLPRQSEHGFQRIVMGLANDAMLLHSLELRDDFGQTTRLSFYNAKVNKPVSTSQFAFVTPQGVDVLRQ